LKSGTAQIKTLKETEISTPLGKIIIGEVMEDGLVIIAALIKVKSSLLS